MSAALFYCSCGGLGVLRCALLRWLSYLMPRNSGTPREEWHGGMFSPSNNVKRCFLSTLSKTERLRNA